jgi:hypothetical protein
VDEGSAVREGRWRGTDGIVDEDQRIEC